MFMAAQRAKGARAWSSSLIYRARRFDEGDGLANTSSAASCARRRMNAGEVVLGLVVDGAKRRGAQSSTPSFLFFRKSRVMAQSRSQSSAMAVVHELKTHSAWASNLAPQASCTIFGCASHAAAKPASAWTSTHVPISVKLTVVVGAGRVRAVVVAHERRVLERLQHRGVVVRIQIHVAGERGPRLVEAVEARQVWHVVDRSAGHCTRTRTSRSDTTDDDRARDTAGRARRASATRRRRRRAASAIAASTNVGSAAAAARAMATSCAVSRET